MQSVIEVEAEALELRNQLSAVVITDQKTYDKAVNARVDGKAWLKGAGEFFDNLVKPAYAAYKNLLDTKKKVLEPVEGHVNQINKALLKWDQEQEQLRREEQRRLEEEARRQAEEEKLRTAVELESNGADPESVSAFLTAPVATAPVVAAPTYERSSAVVYRDNFSGEVTNLLALVKYVAKNPSFIGLLQINQTALNAQAKALKETMSIPGVRAVNNRVVASGRG